VQITRPTLATYAAMLGRGSIAERCLEAYDNYVRQPGMPPKRAAIHMGNHSFHLD
jgi:hypothetical protein